MYGYGRLCGQCAVVGIAAGYGYGGRRLVVCIFRRRCVIAYAIRPFPVCYRCGGSRAALELQGNGLRDCCQRVIRACAVRHVACYLLSARDLLRGRAATAAGAAAAIAARTRGAVLLGGCCAVGGIRLADIEVLIEGYAAGGNVQQVDPTLACQLDLRIRVQLINRRALLDLDFRALRVLIHDQLLHIAAENQVSLIFNAQLLRGNIDPCRFVQIAIAGKDDSSISSL